MAITPTSAPNTLTALLQYQEQRILNQIRNLQNKTVRVAEDDDAKIKTLQQKYNELLQQQHTQSTISQQPGSATAEPAQPSNAFSVHALSNGVDIKA